MKVAIIVLTSTALCLVTAASFAGTIGVYLNPDATGCALTLHEGESATIYLVGTTFVSDPEHGTIASGEFRIAGLPDGWVTTSVPDNFEMIYVQGDPFQDGVRFAFGSLQDGVIPFFVAQLQATSEQNNVVLAVVQHVNPRPPWGGPSTCPWLQYCDVLCDKPGICADGANLFINASGCSMGVDQRTWSAVRVLYR